jgi:hypothetical protein
MSTSAHIDFAPLWSADDLVAIVPQRLPPLHTFEFMLPANAALLHRPSRRLIRSYSSPSALPLFRIAN